MLLNAMLLNDNSFHFHTCKWTMQFMFYSFLAVTLVWFPNRMCLHYGFPPKTETSFITHLYYTPY